MLTGLINDPSRKTAQLLYIKFTSFEKVYFHFVLIETETSVWLIPWNITHCTIHPWGARHVHILWEDNYTASHVSLRFSFFSAAVKISCLIPQCHKSNAVKLCGESVSYGLTVRQMMLKIHQKYSRNPFGRSLHWEITYHSQPNLSVKCPINFIRYSIGGPHPFYDQMSSIRWPLKGSIQLQFQKKKKKNDS